RGVLAHVGVQDAERLGVDGVDATDVDQRRVRGDAVAELDLQGSAQSLHVLEGGRAPQKETEQIGPGAEVEPRATDQVRADRSREKLVDAARRAHGPDSMPGSARDRAPTGAGAWRLGVPGWRGRRRR